MTETPAEPWAGPIAPEGPATLPAVKAQLRITDTADDDVLATLLPAVNELVSSLPIAAGVTAGDEWPARVVQGAIMLCARLSRRRNSPAGVESFGDLGAVYVQRNDPDVAQLLQIGTYTKPQAR